MGASSYVSGRVLRLANLVFVVVGFWSRLPSSGALVVARSAAQRNREYGAFRSRCPFTDSRNFRRVPLGLAASPNHKSNNSDNNDNNNENNQRSSEASTTPVSTNVESINKSKNQPVDADNPIDLNWKTVGKQIGLFQEMAFPYYKESKTGRILLTGLLGLTLANSGVSVLFSYLGKDFWNALSAKDTADFYNVLQKYLGALLLGAPVATFYKYQREQLAVHWREWMTARTFSLYASNRVYYNIERSNAIDNPDQRIAEDVNTFTAYSLQLVITLLTSLIDLLSFATILWSIYPQLFGAIILYAFGGTFITTLLGRSLVSLNFSQLQKEANFRYSLVRLRDNSESIAFYGGEDLEGQAIERRLENVMGNQRKINAAQRNLELFTNSYRYLVQILPVAVVAPKYFAGEIPLGVISQSVGAFNHILSDLSIIVNQFERLSSFSAGIERLSGFYQAMREADLERADDGPLLSLTNATDAAEHSPAVCDPLNAYGRITSRTFDPHNGAYRDRTVLSIEHLDLCTPDQKRLLIKDLNLQLREGENLLIVGNSGAGKSSLLRGIAGLWTVGNGVVSRPVDEEVYFLPQRPYCTIGSLRDQLLYPAINAQEYDGAEANGQKIVPRSHILKDQWTDEELLLVLEKVDLVEVAERAGDGDATKGLEAVLDWSNMLSLGEQQRLAFGRLLVNRPRLVILDEATSALDMVSEARMYNVLKNMARKELTGSAKLSAPGLTYVSVGHRPSLLAYHDKRLRLMGEEDHEVTTVEKEQVQLQNQIQNL